MKFDENLRIIRKQKGLSQEQLAEQLAVSRQAVSKWESGNGYPEMDKLVQISEILECSIDDLLKREIMEENDVVSEPKIIDPKFHKLYNDRYNTFARMISIGVSIILMGVTLYLIFEMQFEKFNHYENIADAVFTGMVAIAVFIFIYFGYQHSAFIRAHQDKMTQYSEREISEFNHRFALMIGLGVAIILSGVVITSLFDYEGSGDVFFMFCTTVAVGILVYYGIQKYKFEVAKKDEAKKIKDKKNEKYSSVIMLSATILFFLFGFIFQQWHYCWIFFPIGGILCAIVEEIIE